MAEKTLKIKLVAYTPNPEKVVASSAKLCYSSSGVEDIMEGLTEENIDKFIKNLVNIGHESPLEHVSFSFAIEGVSRVLTHQLVRHRIASYSQVSQRYVSHDQFEYIIPEKIRRNEKAKELYIKAMKDDQRAYDLITGLLYNDLLQESMPSILTEKAMEIYNVSGAEAFSENVKRDIIKLENKLYKDAIEEARYVLPNGCETKIMVTMNARTLLNFFSLRCCNRAQKEIQEMANEMLRETRKVAPILFKKAGASCTYGKCNEGNMSCGKPIKEFK